MHTTTDGPRVAFLDSTIEEWTNEHEVSEVLEQLNAAGVPVGYPYTAADIVTDPHYQAREMIQTIDLSSGKTLKVPAVLPKLSETPGQIGGGGPALGAHTDEVLSAIGIDQ